MRCSTTTAASGRCSARRNRPLKSLTDMIKGKQGRFRENLLGKRVDYSARSVIVVGPELQAAPVRPAQEDRAGAVPAVHHPPAQGAGPRRHDQVGQEDARAQGRRGLGHPRRGDQATTRCCSTAPRRCTAWASRRSSRCSIEGNAIRIHPLVCKGFNADFDGDQMAVHLPLSIEAQVEAHVLMMSHATTSSARPTASPIITPVAGHRAWAATT